MNTARTLDALDSAANEALLPINSEEALRAFLESGGTIIGVDVDTQIDFVDEEGKLYVPDESGEVRRNLQLLTSELDYVVGSVDSHAYDAWEFIPNGGPFPEHCVKGTEGWLKIRETRRADTRFIPMSEGHLVIGEDEQGEGNRKYGAEEFAEAVLMGGETAIFEKEVYSLFANPNAEPFVKELVEKAGGVRKVLFAVFGYCTGGFCVDAAAEGLKDRGYQVAIIEDATVAIGGGEGASKTRVMADEKGIGVLSTRTVLEANSDDGFGEEDVWKCRTTLPTIS